jgi:hypothetical protein
VRVPLGRLLLAACALLAQPLWADSAASIQSLDACLARLAAGAPPAPKAPTAPAGIDELRPVCPDLEHAIIGSPLADQLPEHWQEWLDRSAIADISWLMHRYQPSQPLSAVPRVSTLYQVAQTLSQPQQQRSWWQELKDWLRQLLSPAPSSSGSWLTRWLPQLALPQLLMRTILYGLLGAILGMALWIVWGELKAAGVGSGAARVAAKRALPLASAGSAQPLTLEDVDAAPLRERPALLLRLLVQALLQSGRLSTERSLTHRELGVRSAFDDPQQHSRFVRLSLLAERQLYGPNAPAAGAAPEPQIDYALTAGRQLYAQLLGREDAVR